MEYRYGSHAACNIEHRFAWATNCRFKVLTGDVAPGAEELVRQACEAFEIRITSGVASKDHVHIYASAPPIMAPSEIMRRMKGRTSTKLLEEFPHAKKKCWGQHFWGRGYFCATSGQAADETTKNCLEHRFEPSPNESIRVEGQSNGHATRIRAFSTLVKFQKIGK